MFKFFKKFCKNVEKEPISINPSIINTTLSLKLCNFHHEKSNKIIEFVNNVVGYTLVEQIRFPVSAIQNAECKSWCEWCIKNIKEASYDNKAL